MKSIYNNNAFIVKILTGMEELRSHSVQVQEALLKMQEELPRYVIDCFVAAGYDTMPAIVRIDEQKLNEIEGFINRTYPEEAKFYADSSSKKCMILPGHREIIHLFISEAKQKTVGLKRKLNDAFSTKTKRKHQQAGSSAAEDSSSSMASALSCIRQQIAMWQRREKVNQKVKNWKEHKEFEVKVNKSGTTGYVATIRCCLCMRNFQLGMKSGKPLISNWTRHIPTCTVPLTSKWTNTRGRLVGNSGVILSCPRNRVSLTAGRCEYKVHHSLVRIRASTVYARESHTTTT